MWRRPRRTSRVSQEFGIAAQVVVTKRSDDISSLAAQAATAKRGPVVAGGGDGTVNAVAGKLAGTDCVLGVLPMGTLNHFAKDVGIPQKLEAAVRNIFTGRVSIVDVGEVNGRIFVNNSGFGFYPHFVRQREELERRGHVKRVAFMLALRAVVRRYFRLRINVHMGEAQALEHQLRSCSSATTDIKRAGLRSAGGSGWIPVGCGCVRRRGPTGKILCRWRCGRFSAAPPIKH